MQTFEEVLDDFFEQELKKEGHTIEEYEAWGVSDKLKWSNLIGLRLDIGALTPEQQDQGVEMGYLKRLEHLH